ncbi:unnamed protein product, partial [Iphiclides podalirius]
MMEATSLIRSAAFLVLLNCATSRGMEDNYANFILKNGNSVSEVGTVKNAKLTWGKWQHDGDDLATVNNVRFNTVTAATFRASGRENSPSGAEGSFEIYEGARKVAVVVFDIPFWGTNQVEIRELDDEFVCKQRGFTPTGSPTIIIKCHKISD